MPIKKCVSGWMECLQSGWMECLRKHPPWSRRQQNTTSAAMLVCIGPLRPEPVLLGELHSPFGRASACIEPLCNAPLLPAPWIIAFPFCVGRCASAILPTISLSPHRARHGFYTYAAQTRLNCRVRNRQLGQYVRRIVTRTTNSHCGSFMKRGWPLKKQAVPTPQTLPSATRLLGRPVSQPWSPTIENMG